MYSIVYLRFSTLEQFLKIFYSKNILNFAIIFAVAYIGFIFLQACNHELKVEKYKQLNFVSSRSLISDTQSLLKGS